MPGKVQKVERELVKPPAQTLTVAPGAGSTTFYNRFKGAVLGATEDGTAKIDLKADTIKVLLVTSSITVNEDHDVVSDIVAAEIAVTGYTGGFGGSGRKSLSTKTVTVNKTDNRGDFGAANLSWTALATGATIGGAVVFKELTNDASSPLIAFLALTNTPTNGSDINLNFAGSIVLHLS